MSSEAAPDWLAAPADGWTGDDLDRLPDDGPRCEVLDGELILKWPQRDFYSTTLWRLAAAIDTATASTFRFRMQKPIRIGAEPQLKPDLVVAYPSATTNPDGPQYVPAEVVLAVDIRSPDTAHLDQIIKPAAYALAGFPHYWLVEEEYGPAVIRVFQLDVQRRRYVETAAERGKLQVERPFAVTVDVGRLYP